MKMIKTTIIVLATIGFFVAIPVTGSQMDPFPIEVKSEPVPMPTAAGLVNLQVTVILKSACENAKLFVSGVDNLQYDGDTVWNLPSNPEDTTILNLQMVIPDNDTSGIGFTCYFSERGKFQSLAYFVADPEKVSFHHGNPRRVSRTPIGVPIDMSDPPKSDEIGEDKGTIWYEDEDGNLVPIDSIINGLSPSGKRVGTIDQNGIFIPLADDSTYAEKKVVPTGVDLGIKPETKYPRWFYIEPDRESIPANPGQFKFGFDFIQGLDCSDVELSVKSIYNLNYFGPSSWSFKTHLGDTTHYELDLKIPDNGISGLTIEAISCNIKDSIWAYFIVENDTVKFSSMKLSKSSSRKASK